ncbi:Serine/threonine-protein kinase PknD [Rubripirellula obstinata]|uniref:Serine/threonine-protein kinase PknD n=1 Tax=Rubripirellula obstinata TaxID=406547 RepID=A0A5B1CMB1_9BACT|nr:protein kinase [Rubripirellula obstinata]KAA1262327.1 Serine/threonine-protein kinase PknD [Rubripirellula obstinata]
MTTESLNLLETIMNDGDLARRLEANGSENTNTVSIDTPTASISQGEALGNNIVPRRNVASMSLSRRASDDPDYRLVGELGSGGTAVVYQAHQRAVDREVAVKMLRSELADSYVSRERFLTEARVIGGLDHPNVIALHEVYVDDDANLYYSMKRIDGTSWDKQIADMTPQQNVETLLRVADGIRYAHSRGLIHRDIKPENVMLGRFGEVLLADWGLAINRQDDNDEADLYQSIGGTPAYMPPELATGFHSDIVLQSDVYLLGATLFQILTGFPPHDGKTLIECISNASKNVIRETNVESELMDVAMKAMETNPEDRYATVDEFIAAIKRHRQHEESVRLTKRAIRRIEESDGSEPYRDYSTAETLLSEAIELWSGNRRAIEIKKKFQMQLAKLASQRGDLDLAATIYESIDESESDDAKRLRKQINQREVGERKVSRYSALFIKSPDPGLLLQRESGKVVELNEAFSRLFGFQRSEVVGKAIDEINLWVCPNRREDLVKAMENHGEVDEFEAVLQHRDGRRVDVLINSRSVKVEEEEMVVSTIRDISLRKKAEQELNESRQRLRDMQRLAGLATWSYDVVTDRVSWSRETFDLTGRNHEEGSPTSKEYFEMVHPDDQERLQRAVRSAIESGIAYEISILQKVAGGEYRDVIVRGQPIFDDQGRTVEVYGVVLPK